MMLLLSMTTFGQNTKTDKEEAAAQGLIIRPSVKGIQYTNENALRFEQLKTRKLSYYAN